MSASKHNTAALQELDRRHFLHPFTDFKALAAKGTRVIVRAEGVYLYDSDGKQILDGMAGLWCVNVGYGRTELADVAYTLAADLPNARKSYQDFLAIWKDADPDIPILVQARREYAKLGPG